MLPVAALAVISVVVAAVAGAAADAQALAGAAAAAPAGGGAASACRTWPGACSHRPLSTLALELAQRPRRQRRSAGRVPLEAPKQPGTLLELLRQHYEKGAGGGWPGGADAVAAHRGWLWGCIFGTLAVALVVASVGLSWPRPCCSGDAAASTASTAAAVEASRQPLILPPRSSEHWLMTLLCATSAIEGADMALLPSCMFALQIELGLGPGQLATLSLWQALLQALSAPLWGVLADRGTLSRRAILAIGCSGWGLVTVMLGCTSAWVPMVLLRALNGLMLACLRPIANGLVPDIVPEHRRGEGYGKIQLSFDIGSMLGALVVTPVSMLSIAGVAGWRASFVLVGCLSLVLACVVAASMHEPPAPGAAAATRGDAVSFGQLWKQEAQRLGSYFRMPTFTLIVVQGVFGMVPWNALGYLTLFLQTAGVGSAEAAIVSTIGRATQGAGHLLGGYIGDACAARWPGHGRPLVAQISVLSGIPAVWLIFQVCEPGPDTFGWYCVIYGMFGLTATWCAAGVNWPIFTEIVPPESRSSIVAWDTALEGISGALLGNLAVAALAEHLFGYRLDIAAAALPSPENARALGRALACTTAVPFVLCLLIYSLMHWTYPLDRRRTAAAANAVAGASGFADSGY